MKSYKELREIYPEFIYAGYEYTFTEGNLEIAFDFRIPPDIVFRPTLRILGVDKKRGEAIGKDVLDNLVFHLGLMEIPSYWKATASQTIQIACGELDEQQVAWWKYLFLKGMGQFFYENEIDVRDPDFFRIQASKRKGAGSCFTGELQKQALIPLGGGKDSVVTLELLKTASFNTPSRVMILNPKQEQLAILGIAREEKNTIMIERIIDPKLLELNRKGYLNGHTPFSAYLAFLSVVCGVLFDMKYLALSNERSSNEGNIEYLGEEINHQYSKTFDFEQRFHEYAQKYLARDIEYFSFLRPLYELQIARIFSAYPQYFPAFISCNEAHKTKSGQVSPTGKWCGKCSKCLFAFLVLYPFMEEKDVFQIFGANLLEDRGLLSLMEELIGEKRFKPFECVGTKEESMIALYLSWKKCQRADATVLPFLLDYFEKQIMVHHADLPQRAEQILKGWDEKNLLPEQFQNLLKFAFSSTL